MKIIPIIFFVAVGIWLAYTFPEYSQLAFKYIKIAVDFVVTVAQNFNAEDWN